jgi:cupin fold WbuC family metalloprotein
MKAFDVQYLNDLTGEAKSSPRLRQLWNIHQDYRNACWRLFNVIEPCSYNLGHRHASEPREELLIAICG